MSAGTGLRLFYGGTFDPVHNGHLAIARAARDQLHCEVRLMPAADPPHRAPPGASASQRADMLDLAVATEAGLAVDRRELERSGRSYTVDTLRELRAECGPGQPLALLVGADSFIDLPDWHEWQALLELAHFVVAPRPGSPLEGALRPALVDATAGRWAKSPQILENMSCGRLFMLDQPLHPGSASEVRRRIARNEDWQSLVPAAVSDYIVAHRLYVEGSGRRTPL